MRYTTWIIIAILTLTSCTIFSIGKKGVFYKEIGKTPEIETFDDRFVVQTQNSNQNSALLIYKIKKTVDKQRKQILLTAYQALGKQYRDQFEIKMPGYSKSELDSFEFFWIDPDKVRNTLTINN
jgi:hypothetical protein